MADKRTADVLLRYRVDQASANQVSNNLEDLIGEIDDLQAQLRAVGRDGASGIASLTRELPRAETGIESLQDEVLRLRKELQSLDDVKVAPVVDVRSAGGGDLQSVDRFGRFGTQFAGAFGASGSVGNVVGFVGDVADSLATLGPAGGIAAAGIGGVSLALAKFTADAEAAAKRIENLISGEAAAEQLVAMGTRDAAEQRRLEILQELKLAEDQLNERRIELLQFTNQLAPGEAGLAAGLSQLNIIIGENAATVETYQNAIDEQQATIARLTAEFIELNSRLSEAPPKLVEINDKFGIVLDTISKIGKEVSKFQGIQGGIGQGMTPFQDSQAELNAALQTTRTDAYFSAMTKTVQAQEALTAAQNAYNEAVAASQQRISDINAKLQADLSQAEADRQNDLADAARQAGEDRVKITEDAEKERARIQSRFEKSYSTAVAERDALAAKRAEDVRDSEQDQLKERYSDQLKAVDKSLASQQKVIQSRYDAQVKTVRAAADASIRMEIQRAQAEINVRQQALQAAQTQMINAANAELMIRSNLYNQTVSQATVWANTMQMIISYGLSIPGGSGGSVKMPTPIPGKASGGPVIGGRPYLVGEAGPEVIVPRQSGYVIPNGASSLVTINLAGAQMGTIKATSRAQVLTTLNRMFDQMGVA